MNNYPWDLSLQLNSATKYHSSPFKHVIFTVLRLHKWNYLLIKIILLLFWSCLIWMSPDFIMSSYSEVPSFLVINCYMEISGFLANYFYNLDPSVFRATRCQQSSLCASELIYKRYNICKVNIQCRVQCQSCACRRHKTLTNQLEIQTHPFHSLTGKLGLHQNDKIKYSNKFAQWDVRISPFCFNYETAQTCHHS